MSTFWESGMLIWLRPILLIEEKTIFKDQLGIAKKALNARTSICGQWGANEGFEQGCDMIRALLWAYTSGGG